MPDDLAAALAAEPKAQKLFDALTSQNRYAVLYRVTTAKRADTRARRIEQFVAHARARRDAVSAEASRVDSSRMRRFAP